MEKYTGEENNRNIEFWENRRILPKDCETTQITQKYIKSICTKLYQKKGGEYAQPDYFDKNFQIVVEDTPAINAAYVAKKHTKDNRNILLVTKGLLANVQNEAQLASVIAHELGHFEVDETREKDRFGISTRAHEHELQADYRGFKSLVEAGYNPDEAISFFEMINVAPEDTKSAYESANNEHGNTSTRIANIKDYKSAYERQGIVFSSNTFETRLKDFQKDFIPKAADDRYISYLEERIREEYNVSSSRELSPQVRWNFCEKIITDELKTLAATPQRQNEFARLFSENVPSVSKEDAIQINRILEKTYEFKEQYLSRNVDDMWCGSQLPRRDKDGDVYIRPLGSLAHKINRMQKLINDKDAFNQLKEPWEANNVAHDLDKHYNMEEHVILPSFSIEGLQKGDTVPWASVAEVANAGNHNNIRTIMDILNVRYDYFAQIYGDSLGYTKGDKNNIYVNAQGEVISTNPEEVALLHQECENKVQNNQTKEQKRQMKLDFHDQLAIMSQNERGSAVFTEAKQQASEIYLKSVDAFTKIDAKSSDYLLKEGTGLRFNPEDKNRPSAQLFADRPYDLSPSYNDAKYAQIFYPLFTEVLLDTELKDIMQVYHSERYVKVDKALDFVNGLYNTMLDKNNKELNNVSPQIIRAMAPSVFRVYGDLMYDTPRTSSVRYLHRIVSQTLLNDNVGSDGNLPYVEEWRARQGLAEANNTDELVNNLSSLQPKEPYYEGYAVTTSKLLYDYEIMRTVNKGADIDISTVLNTIPSVVSPALADKLTDYALQKDLFGAKEGESAEQTYERCKELYITMAAKEAFTSKDDTQRQIESKLLSHMQKLSPERQLEEAYDLISTHANHDIANMEINDSIFTNQTKKEKNNIRIERLKELGGSILQYDGNKQIVERMCANHIVTKHGIDDDTPEYQEKITAELENVSANISQKSRKRICEQVAKGVMAQKQLAYDIKEIHDKDLSNAEVRNNAVNGYNLLDTYIMRNPDFSAKAMSFLLSNGNTEDCRQFSQDLAQEYNTKRYLIPEEWKRKMDRKLRENNISGLTSTDIQNLTIPEDSFVSAAGKLHEEYLNAGFEERAVIMHRLLDSYANESNLSEEKKLQKQISFVSDKIFGTRAEDKYLLQEVKTISTAVCHQEEQPSLLLGAVLSGREPGQADKNMNVGDGLAMFCEKQGTAWVKLAQTLSYVDALPQDIRDSLGRLKDKANEPKQWEIHKDLEEAMPESELSRIKHVKKFIGGGTFNKTILVDVENEQSGKSETKVVQVMHDRAATKSEREFKKINAAIDELCTQDSKYEILRSVAERSAKNAVIEVDIKEGAKQYENACQNYGKIESIELNGVSYIPKVATWERYGESQYSNYKIMEMAPGKSIDSPEFTPAQRREMALAYTAIELSNLMGGKAWDIDRHSKQQNFHVTKDEHGKTIVEIGIFDTGAQRPAPTKDEKKLLGKFLVAVVKEQQQGKGGNLGEFMLQKIKKFEKAGKDVNYVSDVQRGLLAISDIMQYMNTPEYPNGMADGLMTCFKVLKDKEIIDNGLYKTLIRETAKSVLKSPSFAKKALNAVIHPKENTDNLSINLSNNNDKIEQQIKSSVRVDKPSYETEKIELNKTRIKPKPKTPREQVESKLEQLGIDKKSYMLLTPDDKWLETEYGFGDSRSIDGYFGRQEQAAKAGKEILVGANNGYSAAYFAKQDIYVVSPDYKLRNALCGSRYDDGYGVMFSNGERFTNSEWRNDEWKDIKAYVANKDKQKHNNQSKTAAFIHDSDRRTILEKTGRSVPLEVSKDFSVKEQENINSPVINTVQPDILETANIQSPTAEKVDKKTQKGKFIHYLRLGRNLKLEQNKGLNSENTQTKTTEKETKSNINITQKLGKLWSKSSR